MTDLTQVKDFWVQSTDAARFLKMDVLDGLPNADVKKVKAAMGVCTKFRSALDIGAHIGITATLMATRFEQVIAFEAVPETFEALTRNVQNNPAIIPVPRAIGEFAGSLRFEYQPNHGQLSHALLDGEIRQWQDSVITDPIIVEPIDDFHFDEIDFIKIDVEGFEAPVVRGAKETILRCRPVILVEQRGNEKLMHGTEVNGASLFLESLGMVQVQDMPFWKDRVYRFPA